MPEGKIITIRLNDDYMKKLEIIKKDVARFFKISPDEVTYSQCIKYSISTLNDVIEESNKITS